MNSINILVEAKNEYTSQLCSLQSTPSEIIPNLFIGDYMNSEDERILTQLGISVIVNVTKHLLNVFENNSNVEKSTYKPTYLRIPLNDDLRSSILPNLKENLVFLKSALDQGSKVLVHCSAGISRSPAIVIAYLMSRLKISFKEALGMVSEKRNIIEPNLAFTCQLLENEKMIMEIFMINNIEIPVSL